MNKLPDVILDEQKFPYKNMTIEERNSYLTIIKNCKDIKDSKYQIDGKSECQILELRFKKIDDQININGSLSIGTDNIREYRCIDGYIFTQNSSIVVDYHITRLCTEKGSVEYTVLDEFKLVDGRLMRNSLYNHGMEAIETQIDDESMKGLVK